MNKTLMLKEIKLHLGFQKDAQFADFLGIEPNVLSAWYRRNTFDIDILYTKCRGVSPDWLLTGTGEMLRDQNVHNSTHTHTEASAQTSQNQREDTQKMIEGGTVILFDAEAAAGYGSFSEVLSKEKIAGYYNVPGLNHADFLIPISGSSMFPKYASGDILAAKIIDDPQFLQWGRPYIIATRDQGMLCKRIYESGQEDYINVVSENPKYDPFDIPKDDILGFAIVVGVIHRE